MFLQMQSDMRECGPVLQHPVAAKWSPIASHGHWPVALHRIWEIRRNLWLRRDFAHLQVSLFLIRLISLSNFLQANDISRTGDWSISDQQIIIPDHQTNIITSYLDGSQIYGSTEVDALDLRDLFSDHGLLRFDIVSSAQKPYLPFEKVSICCHLP